MRVRPQRLFAFAVLLTVALPAHAVDMNAAIKGVVLDPEGLPVPNAEVVLTAPELMGARNVQTDEEGRFRFSALPPGVYTVKALHPSFNPWQSGAVGLALNATLDLDVTLEAKGATEVITIVAVKPAVDIENVQSGATLGADFLASVPVARDYQSAISLAPGVVGGGNPNARGSFDSSNQYYINGVNVTDPVTNTFSMNMNYDAIESIEVVTGGMDAEYGRALGAAFNIVTKSGGNEFEGTALVAYSGANTIIAPALDGEERGQFANKQGVFNLGGPIVKDKLWFFASLQMDRNSEAMTIDPAEIGRDVERYPLQPYDYRSTYWFGKLTFQPSATHNLSMHAQGDPTVVYNTEQDPYTLPSGETMQKQGGWLASIEHKFTPSQNFLLQTQAFYSYSLIDYQSILWKDCTEKDDRGACTTDFVGTDYLGQPVTEGWLGYDAGDFASGEYPYASFNRRQRMSLTSSATLWADFLGEHEAKVGLQAEVMKSYTIYPGVEDGMVYATHTGGDPMDMSSYAPALKYVYDSDLRENLAGTVVSWYAQDVWKPHDRLVIRPGVRFDMPALKNDIGETVLSGLTVAPRIGVAYDLTGDKKTQVHAYYGRFYDNGFLGVAGILNKNPSGYSAYSWDDQAGDWSTSPDFSVAGSFLAGGDLKNPYSDEVDVGLSREVGQGFGFDINGTWEESHRFWEDDEVNLIWNEEGTDVIGYRNGTNEALYRLRTPDSSFTRYTSVELVARKDFSDGWSLLGSYTWSHAIGTNSSDQATMAMDIPPQLQYETGLLDHDIPHYLKVTGSLDRPDQLTMGKAHLGYNVGWSSFMRSGYPYRPVVWNDYYQDYTNLTGPGDGRYRLPMIANTDVRAMVDVTVGDVVDPTAAFSVGVDVFNLFNDRTVTSVDTRYDPEAVGDEQTFGQVAGRQSPRYFQLILRGEF